MSTNYILSPVWISHKTYSIDLSVHKLHHKFQFLANIEDSLYVDLFVHKLHTISLNCKGDVTYVDFCVITHHQFGFLVCPFNIYHLYQNLISMSTNNTTELFVETPVKDKVNLILLNPTVDYTGLVIIIIIAILAVIGNVGNISAYVFDPSIRKKPSDLKHLNLACAD